MDFELKPEYNEEKKCWDIYVKGEIDIYNSANVKDYLSNIIQERPCDVYIDCKDLEYIDSTGLGALVAIVKKVKNSGNNMYILNTKPNVEKVFKITNLDKVFIMKWGENMQERNMNTTSPEIIELTLPVNSAYVSSARLTASSISNRMGFDIDDIEDIKAAVSEACIFIISKCMDSEETKFHLKFTILDNSILISLTSNTNNNASSSLDENDLGMKVIQTLMDEVEIEDTEGLYKISMKKNK